MYQYGSTGLGGGFLPLDLDAEVPMIVEAMRSGVVLCQLVNAVTPHTVDERVRGHVSAVPTCDVFVSNCHHAPWLYVCPLSSPPSPS